MESGQGASGGMADDQVLSEALDVFDQTMGTQGQQDPSATGMPEEKYGDSDILGQTAGNSTPGTQSGMEGSGQDQEAGMDGSQQDGGTGAAGQGEATAGSGDTGGGTGAMGQDQTAGYGTPGGGGMGQDEPYGSAGYPSGSGGGQSGGYDSSGYPSGSGGAYPGSSGYGGQSGSGGGGAMTHSERVGVLEGRLDEQLAVFDGMILNEQRTVVSERGENATESGRYGSGGSGEGEGSGGTGSGEGDTAPLLTAMARGSTSSNAGGGMMPDLPEDNRKGDFGADPSQKNNIPADIPDGSDDDVVARQLREAAMKETDPVLREKLWDEYRKYKKGVALKK